VGNRATKSSPPSLVSLERRAKSGPDGDAFGVGNRWTTDANPCPDIGPSDFAFGVLWSLAFGVGKRLTSVRRDRPWPPPDAPTASAAAGVAHNEDPVAEVRGSKGRRRNTLPFSSVPEGGQGPKNFSHELPSVDGKEAWDVLHKDVAGSKVPNDSSELGPEPAVIGPSSSLAGDGDRLTWEASADEVDRFEVVRSTVMHVSKALDVRPVRSEDALAEGIALDLPDDTKTAGPFKAEVEAPDARKERPNREH